MKYSTLLFLLTIAAVPLAAQTVDLTKPPVSKDPRPYKLPPVSESKLPNGLTVLLAEDNRFPMVTARLVFLAGNKRDPKDIPGLASSVAAMLMQGTSTHSFQEMAEELDGLGAVMGATTGADSLNIEASGLSGNTAQILALMSDVARNAIFPAAELDLHKANRKQSLIAQHTQPAFLANEEYRKVLFGDTPYAHVGPTAESIDKLSRKALEDFRDAFLVPNNAYLILVGKLPPRAQLTKTIADRFGSWEQKKVPAYVAPKLPESKRELVLVDRPGSVQADMRMGKIAATFSDADFFPENVGSVIEGGGPNSRLFLDIREKRGFAYDVHTEVAPLADAGIFSTVTQVRNEVVGDALQGILDHLDKMATQPVEPQELSEAKSYANGVFLLSMEPQRGLADRLVQMKVMNLPKNYLETYTTKINSVEPDQIENAAKKYMATGDATIVVVGDAAAIEKPLEKFGAVRVVKPAQ
ncbi:MAG TPA: pitrilysin family protein [Bryobacteraceae bacterium]|nr:pitrilysin family protein [Bryobacteraceae bacterium]